ncbi:MULTISPECIES: trypsin-like peptidase domain-containing protein [unclassified Oceanicaulis]|uniref:trypsin-like peptidase domain-containing protein n=1 Tax=unclassified Oceanicaulis TaxID=2632123 RepID=UPI0025DF0315|nr:MULTISPECIES: trypsin-like peptidase domain-containing protein [unclassified Oceanicaulis]
MRVLAAAIFALGLALASAAMAAAQPNDGFADLNDRLSPAVVNIATAQRVGGEEGSPLFAPGTPLERYNDLSGNRLRMQRSLGSGFIIDADGIVITNHHVIAGADEVEVVLQNGLVLDARIVGSDPATDIAVLRVDPEQPLPVVQFGDSERARVGEWVVAIGNPFGLGGSLTAGVISARGREIGGAYDDYLQTDVAINRGNSGGPLFNMDGDVIGVNTAIFSPTGTSVGISFSVPSAIAVPVIDQLIEYGETRRGWIGVNVLEVTRDMAQAMGLNEPRGALLTRIDPEGPAADSGLEEGDVILAFDGRPVADDRVLPRIVAETEPGSRVDVEVFRRGEALTLPLNVERLEEDNRPTPPAGAELDEDSAAAAIEGDLFGMTLEPISDALRRRYRIPTDASGLVVTEVDPNSDAAGKVRPGDVVEEIAWTRVEGLAQARELAARAGADGAPVLFSLNRQGQYVLETLRR